MSSLRKNIASQHIGFCLNAKADGTPVTAGGAGTVVIDNAAQAACSGTFTHKGTGQWDYAPTQAETNGTSICFAFTGTGAIQVGMNFYTDNWDTTAAGVTVATNSDKTGYSLSGTQTFNVTGNITGNLSGSVGSVTGAVGSVTGNVGGNVVGSVGSVSGSAPQTGDAYARLGTPAGASTAADIAAINTKTTNLPASPAAVGSAMTLTGAYDFAKGTAAMTESYAAQGATMTPVQALYQLVQQDGQMAIAGTVMTVKKRDGATTAKTYNLDSSTAPTSITEAT